MKYTFNGHIKDGKLKIVHRKDFDKLIESLSGEVVIELYKKRKTRSNPQNRYYWSALIPIMQEVLKECGYLFTPEQTHEFLKANFNTKSLVNEKSGEVMVVPITTTILTTVEFEEYIERIRVWAWDWARVSIPEPNTQTELYNA